MNRTVARELADIRRMPYGTARTAAAEAVARRIEAEGPREHLAEALLDQIEAYNFNGDGAKSFVVFARLLRLWDESPELFDEDDRRNLFWEFKWVAADLSDYPQISLEQARAFLADMLRRFELAGNGTAAVRMSEFLWRWWAGQPGAEEARLAWVSSLRDEFEDCRACTVGNQTTYLVETGRHDEAVAMGMTQHWTCNKEPACTHHATALAALLAGDPELALARHKLALAATTEDNGNNGPARAKCFELLARGGRLPQALRILRNDDAALLTSGETPLLRLRFLLGLVAGLSANLPERADVETGLRDPELRTVASLHAWAVAEARSLGGLFDVRNGTPHYAGLLALACAARPAEHPLPEEAMPAAPRAGVGVPGGPAGDEAVEKNGDAVFARAEVALGAKRYGEAARLYADAAQAFEQAGWIGRSGIAYAESAQSAAVAGEDEVANWLFAAALPRLRTGGADPDAVVAVLAAWAPVAARAADSEAQIRATAELLDAYPDFAPEGLSEDLAERRHAEWLYRRASLRDTLARSIAASPSSGRDRAVREALAAGEEFAQIGLIADAAHAFWLAGRIQREDGDTSGAVWSLESAFEGFAAAHRPQERAKAASELIELLRDTGQAERADAITSQMLS